MHVEPKHGEAAETESNSDEADTKRKLIVQRMDLTFNGKECQVINFTDITMYHRLEKE